MAWRISAEAPASRPVLAGTVDVATVRALLDRRRPVYDSLPWQVETTGRTVGEVADRPATFYSSERIRAEIEPHFTLIPTTETTGGPARYFRIPSSPTRVGFISPHSHNFCADCNRVRVTTEGQLLLCLGREESLDLRAILRRYPGADERLRQAIITAMRMKPAGHRFETGVPAVIGRRMNVTGG